MGKTCFSEFPQKGSHISLSAGIVDEVAVAMATSRGTLMETNGARQRGGALLAPPSLFSSAADSDAYFSVKGKLKTEGGGVNVAVQCDNCNSGRQRETRDEDKPGSKSNRH